MTTAQVTLTEAETQALDALSRRSGKSKEEILHEAIEQFLLRQNSTNRLVSLRQARGIWRDRNDLPDLTELRKEWDRS